MSATFIGQTISHFTVVAKIGEDASGEIYRATDAGTKRPVALHILSAELAARPEARVQIEREAMIASGLGNAVIPPILEWGEQNGIVFAVTEAPEGETLRDFLERERPHRRNLLPYASRIAGALEALHEAGLVHGPLNPAAILITPRKEIRIYDCGFGNPPVPAAGAAVYYLSPEQARGQAADVRSDIFSYGALLYHMTTGRRPFRGDTPEETLAAISQSEPKPIAQLTSRAPRGMNKLLERCLRKDPQRRFESFAGILPLLEGMTDVYRQNPKHQESFLSRNRRQIVRRAAILTVAAALAAAGFFWWGQRSKADVTIGGHPRQLTRDSGLTADPALSPDASLIAYASDRDSGGNLDIWVQPVSGGSPVRLTSDPSDDREPTFSPDGSTIAFRSERNGGGVYVVPSRGGAARLIAPEGRRPRYSPDGRWIAYWTGPPGLSPAAAGGYKIFIVPASGGAARQIRPDFASCTYPLWSPDGKSLLFIGRPDASRTGADAVDWWVTGVDSEAATNTQAFQLFHRLGMLDAAEVAIPGEWAGDHVFYSISKQETSNIWRADIAKTSRLIETPPLRVTGGSGIEVLPSAAGGLLAFTVQAYNADIWSLPANPDEGRLTGDPKRITNDAAADISPSLSNDGSKLVFQSNRSGHYSVMLLNTASGKLTQVSATPGEQIWPIVSPDGSRVAWSELRIGRYEQMYKLLADGATEILCESCGPAVSGWSSDGRMALVDAFNSARTRIVVSVARGGGAAPTPVLEDPAADLHQARFSPDDRSILFAARMDAGATRIYIAPFHEPAPAPPAEWIALTGGGAWESSPQWSPDGKLVYYLSTRDGFRCVWAQRLGPGNRPSGEPFAVYHMHSARRMAVILPFNSLDLFVGRNQLLLSVNEITANIWTAKVSD